MPVGSFVSDALTTPSTVLPNLVNFDRSHRRGSFLSSTKPAIPIVDIRDDGLIGHASQRGARARAIRDECLASFPRSIAPLVPFLDGVARRWLTRSRSPYLSEIAQVASILGFSGVWLLNSTYQWGCTSVAREEDGVPWLARTLDWPFSGLGRYADVVRAEGAAGDYFSVTWPGYAGVLTAMAPRRFGASVNQAPFWRRTRQPWLRSCDVALNAINTWANVRHIPPDQLLRQTFENCGTFAAAKDLLEDTPVARPVIYTLIGCGPGERCVIERTEDDFETRDDYTSAANDWLPSRPMWQARIPPDANFLTFPSAEAAARSRARQEALSGWPGRISSEGFGWVTPPVLNPYTRLAVSMCPARSILRVVGYDKVNADLPEAVTQLCQMLGSTHH
jgi:hypothetical protein